MEWLALEILSILVAKGSDYFSGICGFFRRQKLKKQLLKNLENRILRKYGNEVFYNDLDAFLMRNKVISKAIENCYETPLSEYKSQNAYVEFNIRKFEEQYPQYKVHHTTITEIIRRCFDIVFQTLNKSNDESVRIVSNIAKELAGELKNELGKMHDEILSISKNVELLVSQNHAEAATIDLMGYFEYIMQIYPEYSQTDYICRKIYPDKEHEKIANAYSTLLDQNRVLLLGEAGYGKTYESITLLRSICIEKHDSSLVPIYLPLSEYGMLYGNIREGIAMKISSFVKGDVNELINGWFAERKLVLILDGIDDILENAVRTKFILDVKDLAQRYTSVFYFVTARRNRYHGELRDFCICSLTGIQEATISAKLRDNGIHSRIPRNYYQLFANPLFLEAGMMVLKENPQPTTFNRSTLFEKLVYLLYEGRNQQKGLCIEQPLCCAEVISLIGEFSYNSFYKPSYGYVDFENQIAQFISRTDKSKIISSIIACDIFRIRDGVTFSHKLFKEFCTAYYMNMQLPYNDNVELYAQLIQKEEWKEVFIFLTGLFGDVQKQDEFLDFILQHNLQLYIDCVEAKSDLCDQNSTGDNAAMALRHLTQIHKTYTYIVTNYFGSITHLFDPRPGRETPPNRKVCIRGAVDPRGECLTYWFDLLTCEDQDIALIPEDDLTEHYKQREKNAFHERKSIKTRSVGIRGDSSRAIAIAHIRNELRQILDNRMLIENRYLLCERVTKCKKQIKDLKDSQSLVEMQKYVDDQVDQAIKITPNLAGYSHGKVDMFAFQNMLMHLNSLGVNYEECVLPSSDQLPSENGSCWVWDLYSDQCKIEFISKYFYFCQIAYKEMVDLNFPNLRDMFPMYLDLPYQMVVYVDLKNEDDTHDRFSDPSLQYYHIASPSKDIPYPDIRLGRREANEHDAIFEEIIQSYERLGRTAHSISTTGTGFIHIIDSHNKNSSGPLADYVYGIIRENLNHVLYELR